MIRKITITACTLAALTTLGFLVAGHWGYRSGRIGFALPESVTVVGCEGANLAIWYFDCPGVPLPNDIRPTKGLKTFLSRSAIASTLQLEGGSLVFAAPPARFAGATMSHLDAPSVCTVVIRGASFRCVSMQMVNVPLWMPFALFGFFPLIAAFRGPLRRRRRRRRGLCVYCAYDLTGNATGVCSECGRRVARDC